ncbi:MAG TPA: prolipoprotein diacylglyceryl transferase family protein [Chloroflexota bacterium]|nr:prolipoprotein diacylglyceryl transferase family protein [Chloroflexota bacterium]
MLIDVDPILVDWGPFAVTWQGLFIGIALLVGITSTAWHFAAQGVRPDAAYDAVIVVVPAGIIGARLFHVADSWNYYAYHPLEILAFGQGGFTLYGAIFGGTAGGFLYARARGLPLGRFFDAVAIPQALAFAIGEVGDLITGAYLGRPTTSVIAVKYINPRAFDQSGAFVQPVAAYEILWNLAIIFVLSRLGKSALPGRRFWLFSFLFALGQFWTGFFRDLPIDLAGLGQTQIIAAIVLVASAMAFALITIHDQTQSNTPVAPAS